MTTDEIPWPEVLVMLSMFCRPETASSMGRVICSSTSLGLAPTQAVVTTTTGTLNCGNRLMGRAKKEATPAATTARTMATMASGLATAVCVSHIMSVDPPWRRAAARIASAPDHARTLGYDAESSDLGASYYDC